MMQKRDPRSKPTRRTPMRSSGPRRGRFDHAEPAIPEHPLRPNWMNRSPREAQIVFFDLETTGGNPQNAAVTEIAAIRYDHGVEVGRFHTLVNPKRFIPRRVQELTGIVPDMVRNAPTMADVTGKLLEFIGDSVLVSHGVLSDYAFVAHAAREYGGQELKNFYICTHLLVSNSFQQIPNKSLSGVAAYFQSPTRTSHRAEADAEMTADVFWNLADNLERSGFHTIEDLLKIQADQQTMRRLGAGILEQEIENKAPTTPGIFYLYNGKHEISYVSAAANLKRGLQDTLRLGGEREVNKLMVDARDFKFERTPHFLGALLSEKEHLRKLHLPIDPRRVQSRSDGFVQLFLSQDILDFGLERPNALPFELPLEHLSALRQTGSQDSLLQIPRRKAEQDVSPQNLFFEQDYGQGEDGPVPVRAAPRLNLFQRLDKYQMIRNTGDALVHAGPLQEGMGWYFGPFERPKEIAQSLREVVAFLKIEDPSLPIQERAQKLWLLAQSLHGLSLDASEAPISKRIEHLFWRTIPRALLGRKTISKGLLAELLHEKQIIFGAEALPRTGVAVLSNPELKELDIAVVVRGAVRKTVRITPEESGRLGSSRYFTRLFNAYHKEIINPYQPMFFAHERCSDIELFAYWLARRNGEGEWADFEKLRSLYSPDEI
jgi:DNA polymerase III epsilon subunit family exonuclease